MKKLLLLIDDDLAFQEWLEAALPGPLFILETAATGHEGLELAFQRKPDLILMDWNLPGWNGLELCRYLRTNKSLSHIPLIMLTGYSQSERKVTAFNVGADDYLIKPFEIEELVARIKAVLRRQPAVTEQDILRNQGITLNLTAYTALVDKKPLTLSATEFSLLHMLMRSAGRTLTRRFLLERIWGYPAEISTRTVDVHIRRLRQKLGLKRAACIQSVHGMGYKFKGGPRPPSPLPGLTDWAELGSPKSEYDRKALALRP